MPICLTRRALTRLAVPSALVLSAVLGACSSDETGPDVHAPTSAKLFVNGVDVSANLVLPAGATTRVQVKFYLADGSEETTIETTHFSSLTFTPTVLATPAGVADHRFQWDVTAEAAAATGSVMVGYGHDALADEDSFGPFPVTVQ